MSKVVALLLVPVLVAAVWTAGPPPAERAAVESAVLDQTATAKLTADWGVDYLHLAKYNGRWRIVNALWQSTPEAAR